MQEKQLQIAATPPEQITFNFEEMKAYLADTLEEYRTAVFNDDGIKGAKKTVAALRKEKEAIKTRVKEVKAAYMAPFDSFKAKADELVALYDEPIDFINGQVQDYEARRKKEKLEEVKQMFAEAFDGLGELIPFEAVANERWLNVSYPRSDIKDELEAAAGRFANEINTIRNTESKYAEEAEALYLKSYDLAAALTMIREKEQFEQKVLEQQREAEERRQREEIARQEREKLMAEQKAAEEQAKAVEEAKTAAIDAYIPEQTGETPEAYLYSINLTAAEKEALEMYMDSVGIEYTEV